MAICQTGKWFQPTEVAPDGQLPTKQENKRWSYSVYDEEDAALTFSSFQVEVALEEIYDRVDFADREPEEYPEDFKEMEGE